MRIFPAGWRLRPSSFSLAEDFGLIAGCRFARMGSFDNSL
jgi:hypothetical protein